MTMFLFTKCVFLSVSLPHSDSFPAVSTCPLFLQVPASLTQSIITELLPAALPVSPAPPPPLQPSCRPHLHHRPYTVCHIQMFICIWHTANTELLYSVLNVTVIILATCNGHSNHMCELLHCLCTYTEKLTFFLEH